MASPRYQQPYCREAALSYWILKCNAQHFRIDARLQDPDPQTTWTVSRYRDEIAPGPRSRDWGRALPCAPRSSFAEAA